MRFQKLLLGAATAFCLGGAPQAMAQNLDADWIVVGESSASGTEYLDGEDICMVAFQSFVDQGLEFRTSTQAEARLVAFLFSAPFETVTLFCASEVNPGRPGRPGRPGDPGGLGDPGGPGRPG